MIKTVEKIKTTQMFYLINSSSVPQIGVTHWSSVDSKCQWNPKNIRGVSRPSDKRGGGHPEAEIRVEGGGWGSPQKNFFRPFGPYFGQKIRGSGGSPGPLTWISHWFILSSSCISWLALLTVSCANLFHPPPFSSAWAARQYIYSPFPLLLQRSLFYI